MATETISKSIIDQILDEMFKKLENSSLYNDNLIDLLRKLAKDGKLKNSEEIFSLFLNLREG